MARGDPWAEDMLPYLDLDRLQERAREQVEQLEEQLEDLTMMGSFDPMSPAVHVWGPVMVLPYSGFQDSDAAIEAIRDDVGRTHIEVVVVDVTGAKELLLLVTDWGDGKHVDHADWADAKVIK